MCRGFESLLRYQNHAVTLARPAGAGIPPISRRRARAALSADTESRARCRTPTDKQSLYRDDVRVGTISSALQDIASHSAGVVDRFLDFGAVANRQFPAADRACRQGASESRAFEKLAATGEGETEAAETRRRRCPGAPFPAFGPAGRSLPGFPAAEKGGVHADGLLHRLVLVHRFPGLGREWSYVEQAVDFRCPLVEARGQPDRRNQRGDLGTRTATLHREGKLRDSWVCT